MSEVPPKAWITDAIYLELIRQSAFPTRIRQAGLESVLQRLRDQKCKMQARIAIPETGPQPVRDAITKVLSDWLTKQNRLLTTADDCTIAIAANALSAFASVNAKPTPDRAPFHNVNQAATKKELQRLARSAKGLAQAIKGLHAPAIAALANEHLLRPHLRSVLPFLEETAKAAVVGQKFKPAKFRSFEGATYQYDAAGEIVSISGKWVEHERGIFFGDNSNAGRPANEPAIAVARVIANCAKKITGNNCDEAEGLETTVRQISRLLNISGDPHAAVAAARQRIKPVPKVRK
jgi:hypothetical protein